MTISQSRIKVSLNITPYTITPLSIVSELESQEDRYDSDTFTENDIIQEFYESSFSEIEDAKTRYMKLKEGSENYKKYRNEVDKQMLLPRRMGFNQKNEKKGDMFLKSFYIGDRYADPFSKGTNIWFCL